MVSPMMKKRGGQTDDGQTDRRTNTVFLGLYTIGPYGAINMSKMHWKSHWRVTEESNITETFWLWLKSQPLLKAFWHLWLKSHWRVTEESNITETFWLWLKSQPLLKAFWHLWLKSHWRVTEESNITKTFWLTLWLKSHWRVSHY